MEEHQGEDAERLGLVGHQLDEDAREADRLAAQLAPDERVAGRRRVALVEDQVDDPEDGLEALGEEVIRWDAVGDPGVADLLLGPDQALSQGRLRDEERPGDLRGRQPTQRPQGQRDLGLDREGRVAAGEDEAQAIVGDRAHLVLAVSGSTAARSASISA